MDLARARAWARSPHGQRALIAAVFLVLTAWYMAFAVQRYETSHFYGDEPEYYLTGVSIYADGDLDLRNQFLAPEPHAFPIPLTHKVPGGDAPVPAAFMPTTGAVFIGPANAVAGVLGVLILFALMNLATLVVLLVVLRRTFGPTVSLAAVALTGLIVPLAWHGASIWVEIPALLAITGALALLPWAGRRWWGATAIGVLLALLPWLHQKFAVLALGMAAAVLLHPARRRFWPLIAGLPIAGIVGTMVFSTALRGRWAFTTGSNTGDVSGAFDLRLGRYVTQPAAWMVDQTRGWIPLAPIWIVALIGLAVLLRAMGGRRQLAFYAVAFVPFFLVYMAGPFLSGDSPPARESLTVLPLAVTLLAAGLSSLRGVFAWAVAGVLATLSLLAGAVVGFVYGMDIYFNNLGYPKLLDAVGEWGPNLAALWPRLTVSDTWSSWHVVLAVAASVTVAAILYATSLRWCSARGKPPWSPPQTLPPGAPSLR